MERYRRAYRIKKKKSIFKNRFFWFSILILIILGSVFYFLFFSDFFQIKKIIIAGERKILKEKIELLVEKKLEKKMLWLKTKSIFLVNFNEIKKDILNNFPQIVKVEIKRRFPHSLYIGLEERLGAAIFCQEDQCFLLDKEGIIFEEISKNESNFLRIKTIELKEKLGLGERVIDGDLLSKILEVSSKLKDLKIFVEELFLVSDEKINIKTAEEWEIYFNPKGDFNWQLIKLKAVLDKEIPQEKRKDLEYIDLRFGNFAPYKYRD